MKSEKGQSLVMVGVALFLLAGLRKPPLPATRAQSATR